MAQLRDGAGVVFDSVARAREHFQRHGVPRLCIFRGTDVDELGQLAMQVRDVTLVLDELDRAFHGKTTVAPAVQRILHEGRHIRVDLFGTFRSTRNVSEDVLNAADVVFLFRHSDFAEYDVQTIRRRFGSRRAELLGQLEPGQFVIAVDE